MHSNVKHMHTAAAASAAGTDLVLPLSNVRGWTTVAMSVVGCRVMLRARAAELEEREGGGGET